MRRNPAKRSRYLGRTSRRSPWICISLILIVLLVSCAPQFESVDTVQFNASLADRQELATPEDLMKFYYGEPEGEGRFIFSIQSEQIDVDRFRVLLVHDGLLDDSQRAVQIRMVASKKQNRWHVHSIERNWKCWPGRGHKRWGTNPCM